MGTGSRSPTDAIARIEQLVATCEQLERERDHAWNAAITAAVDACTNIIKNYDCMKSDGETYQPMWVQKVAKGMVDIARQDVIALLKGAKE